LADRFQNPYLWDVATTSKDEMKYSELERRLKKAGCFLDGEMHGHPLWFSPITKRRFKMSHHKNQEVKTGTLKSICKEAGINL